MNSYHTNQQIFDRVVTAMLAQGQRAMDGANICMYRGVGAGGAVTRCALELRVVLIVGDEAADGIAIAHVRASDAAVVDKLFKVLADEIGHYGLDQSTIHFLTVLQRAHDASAGCNGKSFRQDFGDRARAVAVLFDLNTVKLDEELAKYTSEHRTPESTL